jgi:hypothetical protein
MNADRKEIDSRPVIARYLMVHVTALGRNNTEVFSIYELEISAKPAH